MYEFYAENPAQPIRNSRIAKEMGVSQASSSEMIQRLAGKGIVYHIPYRGSTLTEEGLAAAARIKRRECLMEVFLVRMIDYKGDVKAAACRLEHALTDDLEVAIDRLLGYPETTPDGQSQIDNLNLEIIEKVEVIRGVGSSLYGNSSAGIIKIKTLQELQNSFARIGFSLGSNQQNKSQFFLGQKYKKTSYTFLYSQTKSNGYRNNSGFKNNNLNN